MACCRKIEFRLFNKGYDINAKWQPLTLTASVQKSRVSREWTATSSTGRFMQWGKILNLSFPYFEGVISRENKRTLQLIKPFCKESQTFTLVKVSLTVKHRNARDWIKFGNKLRWKSWAVRWKLQKLKNFAYVSFR